MTSLIYLTTQAPSRLAEQLELHGYTVHEALAVSEILYLLNQYKDISAVIVQAGVEDADMVEVQVRRPCMMLKPNAKIEEILFELERLFPSTRPEVIH
jgi:hypothetical protein